MYYHLQHCQKLESKVSLLNLYFKFSQNIKSKKIEAK